MISADARLAAVRGADGVLLVSHGRRSAFTRNVWLRRAGASDWSTFAAATAAGARAGTLRCDRLGCTARRAGQRLAIVADPRALAEDCRHADVIVSFVPVRGRCPRPHTVVDRFDVHRDGSHAIWLAPAGARVLASNPSRGDRPWVPRAR